LEDAGSLILRHADRERRFRHRFAVVLIHVERVVLRDI